jgi:hypothetical protein
MRHLGISGLNVPMATLAMFPCRRIGNSILIAHTASKKIQIRTMISNWHFVDQDSGLEKVHECCQKL